MITIVWLLLCYLSSVNMIQLDDLTRLPGVPSIAHDEECNNYYLHIIRYYFIKTTITPKDSEEIEYCSANNGISKELSLVSDNWEYSNTDLDNIINYYSSLPHVCTYDSILNKTSAVESYGVIQVSNSSQVPLYLSANILYQHTRNEGNPRYPHEVKQQMRLMGQLGIDKREHLLPLSLGGDNRTLNIIPMARNLSQTHWKKVALNVLNFLQENTNGRVQWKIALQYSDNILLDPGSYHSFRPQSITLQYTMYKDQNDDHSISFRSSHISFSNVNNFDCNYLNTWFCRCQKINPKCLPQMTLTQPAARGEMGRVTDQGTWNKTYEVGFSYTIAGRHFFYGQGTGNVTNWFIHELLQDGRMGPETDCGYYTYNHSLSFPFSMDNRQFFYGYDTQHYSNWFIQELLPDGKMGREICQGSNTNLPGYTVGFAFDIYDRHYIYEITDFQWRIRELLPVGRMGGKTDYYSWKQRYIVAFSFLINGRQFVYHYGYDHYWFIQELLPGGKMRDKMGQERGITSGWWPMRYAVAAPFSIGGKQYFYAQNTEDNHNWFIRELLPGGQMGRETDHGTWNYTYSVWSPFSINDRQYFYGSVSNNWVIQELL